MVSEFDKYADLHDDDELAFAQLVEQYQMVRDDNVNQLDRNEDGTQYIMEYMRNVLAAADALNIETIKEYGMPSRGIIHDNYDNFEFEVQRFVTKVQIRAARRVKVYSVSLDDDAKERIHNLLNEIRGIIQGADIEERKKNSLLSKLALFSADVDRARTRFDNAMLFLLDGAYVVKKYGESLNPINELMKRVSEIMGTAKDAEPETAQLPPPAEQKKLEPPKKQIEGPKYDDYSRSDDIPF